MNEALLLICIILACLFVVSLVLVYKEYRLRIRSEELLDHMLGSMLEVIKEDITAGEEFTDENGNHVKSLKISSKKNKKQL